MLISTLLTCMSVNTSSFFQIIPRLHVWATDKSYCTDCSLFLVLWDGFRGGTGVNIFPNTASSPSKRFRVASQGVVGMANKGPSYGMSRQVQDKIDSKYDPELEQILVEWIHRQCGSGVGQPEAGKMGFQSWLKDGCVSERSLFQ